MSFKFLQGGRVCYFPGQHVPIPDIPLGEENILNIQSNPLVQLETFSCPITNYLGDETDPTCHCNLLSGGCRVQ